MRDRGRSWGGVLAAVLATFIVASSVAAAKPPASASWPAGTTVSPVLQPDPTRGSQTGDVAVNASGLAVAAWDQVTYTGSGGVTIGAAIESGGRWSAPFTVSGATGFSTSPRVAVSADGTVAVSWRHQDPVAQASPKERVQVAVRAAGSTTWTTTTLAEQVIGGTQGLPIQVPIAFDGSGNLTAAWTIWNGTVHVVQAATLPKGGQSWTVSNIEPGFDGIHPDLAVNAQGAAALVYATSPYTASGSTVIRYVYRPGPAATWDPPITVSRTVSTSTGYASNPQVGLDAGGLATVAYMGAGIEATRQLSAVSWTPPVPIIVAAYAGSSYMGADLAIDNAGNCLVAISIFDATVGVDRASAWVSRGTPDGTWSASPTRLTDPTVPVDAYATRAAVSPDGKLVLVAWIDHYHGVVQAARLDTATGRWTTSNVGRGTAFSSFQEMLALDVASSSAGRALWKNAKSGTQWMVSDYRP